MKQTPHSRTLWIALFGATLAAGICVALFFKLHNRAPGYSSGQVAIANPEKPVSDSPTSDAEPACQNFFAWACEGSPRIQDPSGSVLRDIEAELSVLRLYEELIRTHPNEPADAIDVRLARALFTPDRTARIHAIYAWVRQQMLAWIEALPSDRAPAALKKSLIARIERTELDLPHPTGGSYADEPDLLTKSGAYYERTLGGSLRVRLGGAYVQGTTSLFNLTYTLAHELAHAIDPCELEAAGISSSLFEPVSQCFVRRQVVQKRETKRRCLAGDTSSEAFADWVAAEIVSRRLKQFAAEFDEDQLRKSMANSIRDLCPQGEALRDTDLTHHPAPKKRIEILFGRHPVLRDLLGCSTRAPAGEEYCEF